MKYIYFLFICCIFFSINLHAQLVVNQSFTPQQLVNKLLGPGVQVSNVTYTGSSDAIGYFDGTVSNLGIDSGLVLSTGYITDLQGPNMWDDISGDFFLPGDSDLDQLSGFTTYDATILEFDFVPVSNFFEFKFVFGSDEYDEYVCSDFNDVFGFFVSGPGITGQQNLALVPGSNDPITINNINIGVPGFYATGAPCNLSNSAYFVSNPPFTASTTVELDGFTVVLTVNMQIPFPCQPYHIKMAIADAEDGIYDSAIFLKSGSFSSGVSGIVYTETNLGDSVVVEGCTQGKFIFEIPNAMANDTTLHFNITGTAINGMDYVLIPDSIIIPAGDTVNSITITPIDDGSSDNNETVIITLQLPANCSVTNISDTLWIHDYTPVEIIISGDSSLCAGQPGQITAVINGGTSFQTFQWNTGEQNNTISVNSGTSQWYVVYVNDICGTSVTDSFFVEIQQPAEILLVSFDDTLCVNEELVLTASATTGSPEFSWNFGDNYILDEDAGNLQTIHYTVPGIYTIEVSALNTACPVQPQYKNIFVKGCEIFIPNIVTYNNDNKNDSFYIRGLENFPNSMVQIFNRWGTLIFESANYENNWTGENESDGVYFYILRTSEGEVFRGNITLVKK